ncbi:flagellar filament capping protein FliD [Cognatilysobacter bugurensis]|uniref:Flagellar hook-associated protein 2 n=1 Tax=Cognatilysobacter bugurensis TaxID=543356 RepID=A0A918T4P1_9GAMM|nr:flagellar filament capping protein FliD [Lysobacter bugurensis]GHA90109.1 flagellar hook-associated protein 2 [Lysobacter bugurensis]
MASISSAGIGSGIDVLGLVSQLVAAERAPTDQRLARFESTTKARISAFGALRGGLSGLESAIKKFDGTGADLGRKATVGDGAGFTATVGTTAALGTYRIGVEALATAHKLHSAAGASTTQIGYGTLSITVGSDAPIDVTIAQGKGTLSDIRDAINAKTGGQGVSASVVRGDAGDVLVLSSTKPGTAGALTISASGGDGGLGVLATTGGTMTTQTAAADAKVVIDGITRTHSGNKLTDAISGVTLDLTKAKPGEVFSLEVTADPSPVKASLLTLISSYNTALNALRTQSASGGEGKVAGPLGGDSAPRGITQSLRGLVSNNYSELAALGFKTAVDGSISMDGAAFDKAIAADPGAVARIFGSEGALGKPLRSTLTSYIGNDGLLTDRTKALDNRIKQLSTQREAFNARMGRVEEAYRRQFTALDSMMSKMQSTSSYLTQQLAQFSKQS